MGSSQMLASKNSQENVNSNNAQSVNDYSSSGLSLQRKAITMQGNSNVMQRMAWVATKNLDKLADHGIGEDVTHKLDKDHAVNSKFVNGKRVKYDYNSSNVKFRHRHFVFSPLYMPKGRNSGMGHGAEVRRRIRELRNKSYGGIDNNIGFKSANDWAWGDGQLFSEDVMHRGYTLNEKISYNDEDDNKLLNAISRHTPTTDKRFSSYSLPSNNCQDWIEAVRDDAGL